MPTFGDESPALQDSIQDIIASRASSRAADAARRAYSQELRTNLTGLRYPSVV